MRSIATSLVAALLMAWPLSAQTRFDLGNQVKNQLPVNYLGDARGVSTPTADTFSTSTSGGTLTDATTYYYRVSATTATGQTLAFAEQSQTTGSGGNTNTVTVNWLKVNYATGYKVYCRSTGAELLCATIASGDTLTWVDDGSVTPSGALPTRDSSADATVNLTTYRLKLWDGGDSSNWGSDLQVNATSSTSGKNIAIGTYARSTTGNYTPYSIYSFNSYEGTDVAYGSIDPNHFQTSFQTASASATNIYGISDSLSLVNVTTEAAGLKLTVDDTPGQTLSGNTYGIHVVSPSAGHVSNWTGIGFDNSTGASAASGAWMLAGNFTCKSNATSNCYGINLGNVSAHDNAFGFSVGTVSVGSSGVTAVGLNIGNVTATTGTAYAIKTGTGLVSLGGAVDSSVGYRVSGAAASGKYLKGDGTNFVASTGLASGTGSPTSCTNQFVTAFTLNSDAAPTSTCTTATLASAQFANQGTTATVLTGNASGNPSFSSVSSTQLAAANKTIAKSVVILSPTTSNTNQVQWYYGQAVTLTRVACSTDTGTVTIQLDKRAEATPNTAGTNALTSSLSCTTTTGTTTSFSSSGVSADIPLNLQITATTGTPGVVRIHADATID